MHDGCLRALGHSNVHLQIVGQRNSSLDGAYDSLFDLIYQSYYG